MYERPTFIWLVYDRCGCDNSYCTAKEGIKVFTSEQTARQEAEQRSKRWGGQEPWQHIDKVQISTKTSGF